MKKPLIYILLSTTFIICLISTVTADPKNEEKYQYLLDQYDKGQFQASIINSDEALSKATQPGTKALLHRILAKDYLELSLFEKSENHIEKAIALDIKANGPDSLEQAQDLIVKANLQLSLNRIHEADKDIDLALVILKNNTNKRAYAEALHCKANINFLTDNGKYFLTYADQALSFYQDLFSEPHANLISIYNSYYNYYFDRLDFVKSEECLNKAIDMAQKLDHPIRNLVLMYKASLMINGYFDLKKAYELLQESENNLIKHFGKNNFLLTYNYMYMVEYFLNKNELETAESILNKAQSIVSDYQLVPNHMLNLSILYHRAKLSVLRKSSETVKKEIIELIQKISSVLGPNNIQIAYMKSILADAYIELKEPEKSLTTNLESLKIHEEARGKNHFSTIFQLIRIGNNYLVLKELDRAQEYYNRAYDILIQRENIYSVPLEFFARITLAQRFFDLKQYDKTSQLLLDPSCAPTATNDISNRLSASRHLYLGLAQYFLKQFESADENLQASYLYFKDTDDVNTTKAIKSYIEIINQYQHLWENVEKRTDKKALSDEHRKAMNEIMHKYSKPESFKEAQGLLSQYDEKYGSESLEKADLLLSLITLSRLHGNTQEFVGFFPQILSIQEKHLGKDDPALIPVLEKWGTFLSVYEKNYPKAEIILKRALSLAVNEYGEYDYTVWSILTTLHIALSGQGKYDEAVPIVEKIGKIRLKLSPDEVDEIKATTEADVAITKAKGNKFNAEFQEKFQAQLKYLKEKESNQSEIYKSIAHDYEYDKETDMGKRVEKMVQALKAEYKTKEDLINEMIIWSYTSSIASTFVFEEKYDLAIPIYQFLINQEKDQGRLALFQAHLGRTYHKSKNYNLAIKHYQTAKEIYIKIHSANHEDVIKINQKLSRIFMDSGKLEEAEIHYLETLKQIENNLPKTHPLYVDTLDEMRLLYRKMRNYEKAQIYKGKVEALDPTRYEGKFGR
ncbi:MAG: tetratricopeptide repeat protein [Chlamydiota bacterium]|nr:tetratricopeptide repeat protein [Chlamydiota bacterium]